MSVSPCLAGEQHVSSGGTATFEVTNYAYTEDAYYVRPKCSGIVSVCRGGGYYYADPYASVEVDIPYTISQQSGSGVAGADITSTWVSGDDIVVGDAVYGQPALVIDSAQTPAYGADQRVGRCAVSCFTATASISTVPFYTLGQARNLTLVYSEERTHPKPFIYATVSPAQDGGAVDRYYFSATLNGASVTFTNGEQTLTFLSPGNVPVRLGGQVSLPSEFDAKNLIVTVVVQYAGGGTTSLSYASKLVVYDASGSSVARGWTIANITQLACNWQSTWQGCIVFGGDGSLEYYPDATGVAEDHSTLMYNSSIGRFERKFIDGSEDQYAGSGLLLAHIDPVGRATTFGYDGSNRLIQIVDPRRNAGAAVPYIQLGYDANGLHTITEQGGPGAARTTTVIVDANRNLVSVYDPDGQHSNFEYDGANRLYVTRDRLNNARQLMFDAFSKVNTSITAWVPIDAGGGNTTMQNLWTYYTPWQGIGVPTGATAGSPPYATLASDVTATIQAPAPAYQYRITQFAVNAWGAPATSIDPLDQWRYVLYTGRDPTRVINTNGERDTTVYDAYDRPIMVQPAGESPTYYHYNAASQVDSTWGANTVATHFSYNADNTLAAVWDASGVSVSYTYNANKQVQTATDNGGHQTSYGYDPVFGNPSSVTLPGSRTTTVTMDAYGRDSVVQAPTLAAVTTEYDLMNRPTRITPAGRAATVLGYDALHRTDVTDANGNGTHTDYNALGWPTARRDASNATETFRYDVAGRKTSWTNRRGTIMSYTYDEGDHLTSRFGANINDSYSYSDDPVWGDIMVASNAIETDSLFHAPALDGAPGADSTVTWVNGVRYRTLRPQAPTLSTPLTLNITALGGPGVQFTARLANRDPVTGLTTSAQDGFASVSARYNNEALPFAIDGMQGGVSRYYNYLTTHNVSWASYSASALSTQFGQSYHYDAAGRLDAAGNPYGGTQRLFHYDQYGELTGVDTQTGCSYQGDYTDDSGYRLGCGSTTSSTSYTYDNVGNRTDLGATYYTGNRLALFSGGWYAYDADGNVSQKYLVQPNGHNQQFYWNPENRLDSLRVDGYYLVQYQYNAFGQPVEKYRQGALDRVWLWDGDNWLAEFDGTNHRISEYQYAGLDQPVASVEGGTSLSSINYTEQDALGNVTGTHNGATVTETISYDAWGMPSYTGDLSSRVMWKGLLWEGGPNNTPADMVGLYYMRGRWYDPQAGRFIQEDPLGVDGSINLYGFSGDDPVNGSDPSGMSAQISCYYIAHASSVDGVLDGGYYYEPVCEISGGDGSPAAPPTGGEPTGYTPGGGGGSSGPGPQQPKPAPNRSAISTWLQLVTRLSPRRLLWDKGALISKWPGLLQHPREL